MVFAGGEKRSRLRVIGHVAKRDTGTTLRFWPDPRYFDTVRLAIPRLKQVLRAKAVLCPGLRVCLLDEETGEAEQWQYQEGLKTYLTDVLKGHALLPPEPFMGSMEGHQEAVDWAVHWLIDEGEAITESYVNLVPTLQGGTMSMA